MEKKMDGWLDFWSNWKGNTVQTKDEKTNEERISELLDRMERGLNNIETCLSNSMGNCIEEYPMSEVKVHPYRYSNNGELQTCSVEFSDEEEEGWSDDE